MVADYRKTVIAVLLSASGLGALAQTSAQSKAVLLVQRIDDVLYGVDPISLALVDAHHVSGVLVRVSASLSVNVNANQPNQPSPPLSYTHFVADCRLPLRLATLATATSPLDLTPQGASARARLASANAALGGSAFVKTKILDASRSTAEFFARVQRHLPSESVRWRDIGERG